ncbi:MAG: CADD family putative folate metabolism protein [Gammaproteobacteria bacterium]|nr:CADD family putative folate metabolism protein [Gammaproteobacteria bacterium]
MQLIDKLNLIISEHHLLNHRFYQAWSNGELSREILQKYAAQYYDQPKSFPLFISRVHTNCPEIEARKVLLHNLVDEEIHGTDHPALWMQFAEGMGVSREIVLNEIPLPETKAMIAKFYELAERDWKEGLCALYAYECQVPEISASKIAGLKKFYGIQDDKTLEFFTAHQAYDVEHAQQVAKLIERYVEPKQAEQATREAALALWGFLDGMCRVGGISCEMEQAH